MKSILQVMIAAAVPALVLAGGSFSLPEAWQPLGTVLAAEKEKGSSSNVQVTVVRATQRSFPNEINMTGYLAARDEAVVNLIPDYTVSEVLKGEGDWVKSGEVLAKATPPSAGQSLPGQAADRRPATLDLKAPEAGIVTRSTAVVGLVGSATAGPLFRIVASGDIEFDAEIGSIYVPMIARGQRARIIIEETGRWLNGTVRLAPGAVDQNQRGRARVSFERDPKLKIGMFARGTITAGSSEGLSIPNAAVFHTTEGTKVQVVRDNTVETRKVQVGVSKVSDVEIVNGLKEGELVVANAGSSLRDGSKVIPVEVDSQSMGRN
jgi:HlyD family secretion protein